MDWTVNTVQSNSTTAKDEFPVHYSLHYSILKATPNSRQTCTAWFNWCRLQGWGQENFCRSGAAVKFWGWGEVYGNAMVTEKKFMGMGCSRECLFYHVTVFSCYIYWRKILIISCDSWSCCITGILSGTRNTKRQSSRKCPGSILH